MGTGQTVTHLRGGIDLQVVRLHMWNVLDGFQLSGLAVAFPFVIKPLRVFVCAFVCVCS